MAIKDPVWREDIVDQADVARDSARVLNDFAQRLRHQGAPTDLVRRIEVMRDQSAWICDELNALLSCFPHQP